jgi:spectinomycin phosphotransferase
MMLEKPNLSDAQIIASLRVAYGIPAAEIEFLPLGNDSSAWVYRVTADKGTNFFLKVKKGAIFEPSVLIPRYLNSQGIQQVVAPLLTRTQTLWVEIDPFNLILYPFIEGSTGMDIGLRDSQWAEFGAVLKQIHSTQLPGHLMAVMRRETFSLNPKWLDVVRMLDANMDTRTYRGVFEQELAAFWLEKRAEIRQIVARAAALGRRLQKQSGEFVLCHCDIHTANILIDSDRQMHIVDWDHPMLAPKERDLMFVIGAVIGNKVEALFFEGYGRTEVDALALAYYRYEWVVQEISDYAERVFLMDDVGVETKADAVREFRVLFAPGDVVDAAYGSENGLPPEMRDRG